jgi:Pyruvate/2-oxoacid:ferredoxin oxidoreductase gamma subunit
VAANLVILGCAVRHGGLFCGREAAEGVIGRISRDPFRKTNLAAFQAGYSHEWNSGPGGGAS